MAESFHYQCRFLPEQGQWEVKFGPLKSYLTSGEFLALTTTIRRYKIKPPDKTINLNIKVGGTNPYEVKMGQVGRSVLSQLTEYMGKLEQYALKNIPPDGQYRI